MREHQARTEPARQERETVLILSAGGSCRPVRGARASFPGSWGAVSAVSIYMRQVYMWMTAGLAITAVTAFAVASSPDLQMAILGNMVIMIALIVAQFGMVIALGAAIHKMSATTATAVFIAYSALTGLTLSSIFVVYPIGSIANAFLTATGTFLAMSVYGTVTKRDLTGMGNFLMMGWPAA